jgi:hypothetical protein
MILWFIGVDSVMVNSLDSLEIATTIPASMVSNGQVAAVVNGHSTTATLGTARLAIQAYPLGGLGVLVIIDRQVQVRQVI